MAGFPFFRSHAVVTLLSRCSRLELVALREACRLALTRRRHRAAPDADDLDFGTGQAVAGRVKAS